MKVGVPIAVNEQRKFPLGPLNVEFKERMRIAKGSTSAGQKNFIQKQVAVWKFQKEQHDWLQLVFHKLSDTIAFVETPVFPSWVIKTEGEEEGEKDDNVEEEVEEEQPKRKRVIRKQQKGKKKMVEEPEIRSEELYDSDTEEDEEVRKVVKEIERNEEEEDTESEEENEKSDEESVDMEAKAKKICKGQNTTPCYHKSTTNHPSITIITNPSPGTITSEIPIQSPNTTTSTLTNTFA